MDTNLMACKIDYLLLRWTVYIMTVAQAYVIFYPKPRKLTICVR